MVKRIVKRFHPDKIILFGSHARGDAGPDSDVDLLVVMDFEGRSWTRQWKFVSPWAATPFPRTSF